MNTLTVIRTIRWETWELSAESDRFFRRIAAAVATPIALLAVLMQLWQFAEIKHEEAKFDSTQYVQLLPPEPVVLAPKPEAPKAVEPVVKPVPKAAKPEVKPEKTLPPPPPTKTARDVASKSGVMAFADQLADLRDKTPGAINTPQALNNTISSKGGIGAAVGGSPDAVAASAAAGSGGINNNGVTTTEGGNGLGTRSTGAVKSPLGFGTDRRVGGGEKLGASRSLNDIKLTIDRNAGAFNSIFNRAARDNENIGRGTIRISMTIAPNGTVTACTLVSSSYNDAEFERKVIERMKLVNFGAKDVPAFTTIYPIYFTPP